MTARTNDTKLFHRLVNAQRKNNTDIDELRVVNKLFCGQEEVLLGFKEHFQNLATEKLNPNYFTYFVPVFKYCYSDSRNL